MHLLQHKINPDKVALIYIIMSAQHRRVFGLCHTRPTPIFWFALDAYFYPQLKTMLQFPKIPSELTPYAICYWVKIYQETPPESWYPWSFPQKVCFPLRIWRFVLFNLSKLLLRALFVNIPSCVSFWSFPKDVSFVAHGGGNTIHKLTDFSNIWLYVSCSLGQVCCLHNEGSLSRNAKMKR